MGSVVDRYADRLAELRWTLGNGTIKENATTTAVEVRATSYGLLMAYLDLANYSSEETSWIRGARERCATTFTGSKVASASARTPGEQLVQSSIEGVLNRTCGVIVQLFEEAISLGLPVSTEAPKVANELERRAGVNVERWRAEVEGLMDWLGWPQWVRCDTVCGWDVSRRSI